MNDDTITIPRTLAFRLFRELEALAEIRDDKKRSWMEMIVEGDMPETYYELCDAVWPPIKDKFNQ